MAEQIQAQDVRPGMIVEVTVRARVTDMEQSWLGPVKLTLLGFSYGAATALHEIVLKPDDEVTRHE